MALAALIQALQAKECKVRLAALQALERAVDKLKADQLGGALV